MPWRSLRRSRASPRWAERHFIEVRQAEDGATGQVKSAISRVTWWNDTPFGFYAISEGEEPEPEHVVALPCVVKG